MHAIVIIGTRMTNATIS